MAAMVTADYETLKELDSHAGRVFGFCTAVTGILGFFGFDGFKALLSSLWFVFTLGRQAAADEAQAALMECLRRAGTNLVAQSLCGVVDPAQYPLPEPARWALVALLAAVAGGLALGVAVIMSIVALWHPLPTQSDVAASIARHIARKQALCTAAKYALVAGVAGIGGAELIAHYGLIATFIQTVAGA